MSAGGPVRSIAIIGAGAMGSCIGAELSGRHKVLLVDTNPEIVDAVTRHGLRIERPGAPPAVQRIRAVRTLEGESTVDLVIFLVKGFHLPQALAACRPLIGPATTIACFQNGWGHHEHIRSAYPDNPLVMGITYSSATVLEPGVVSVTSDKPLYVGSLRSPGDDTAPSRVADAFEGTRIAVRVVDDIRLEIWKKLVLNSGALPVAALTGACAEELAAEPLRGAVLAIARETVHVAAAIGCPIDWDERRAAILETLVGAGRGKSSMLQDIEAGRRTEILTISGAVASAAAAAEVPAPLNELMLVLVQARETRPTASEGRQ